MRHPSQTDLALFAGQELGILSRWRLGRHTRVCPQCRRLTEAFRRDRFALLDTAADLPSGLQCGRLAAEMRANIHLGLAAGECVAAPVSRPGVWHWRPALAFSSAVLLVVMGWWLNLPQPKAPEVARVEGVEVEATSSGIEIKQDDRALTLLSSRADEVTLSVNTQGVLRARYVDRDTGHVTINNVYAQ